MIKNPIHSIDYEMADRITVSNLKDTMSFLIKRNTQISNTANITQEMSDNYVKNTRLIEAFKLILEHYGEKA